MRIHQNCRIFISYAHRDGAVLATRLQKDLASRGYDVWLDTQRLSGGAVWTSSIEYEIDTRSITVALLTPGSYTSEICRAEQLRTLRKGHRLIPVLAISNSDRPLHIEARQYRDFTDSSSYDARLNELLQDINGNITAALPAYYQTTRLSYITAPPHVTNYIERPEVLQELRNILFSENACSPIALTAVAGMGGIGKTVLAQALIRDEVVQQAFPDGIVWITAGKEARHDFTEQMKEVAKALGDDLSKYQGALSCQNQYRTMLASKAALIIIDDVWSLADIQPLLADSMRSRLLFTTRDASIARFIGACTYRAELMNLTQSRELLIAWANPGRTESLPMIDEFVRECGQLPLALAIVGAMLRSTDVEYWNEVLSLLQRVDLSAIQERLPQGQESFFKAVEVSFQAMMPNMRKRYKALAVLLEDMAAPLPILQTLWDVSEAEARHIAGYFIDRSLALPKGKIGEITLHDLQLDYLYAHWPDRDALNTIHQAVQLSSHVIFRDPSQFASQLTGRLLPHQNSASIREFITNIAEGAPKPWLRPLKPGLHPPGTSLVRTLEGHSDFVCSVAMSADGRRAISGSWDKTLKLWDVLNGHELRTFVGHPDVIYGVALSRDGQIAISACDQLLKLWDTNTGHELLTLKGHSECIHGVAISTDGKRAVSASSDNVLKIWDLQTGREIHSFIGHSDIVYSVAFVGNNRIISASADQTLKIWDIKMGCQIRTLQGHSAPVYSVAASESGNRAVSASGDETVKVWDLETGGVLHTFKGHSGNVLGVAISACGQHLVSASADKTLKVWSLTAEGDSLPLVGHSNTVAAVAMNANGDYAVSASYDHTLKVWNIGSPRLIHTVEMHSDIIHDLDVSYEIRRGISGGRDGTLKVWNIDTGQEILSIKGHSGPVYSVALSAGGERALSSSWDGTLKVWDLNTGQELRKLGHTKSHVPSVALTRDGCRALSSTGSELRLWDVEDGRELLVMDGNSEHIHEVALSSDGQRGICSAADGTLRLWDTVSGTELRVVQAHSGVAATVSISADGRQAASAAWDRTFKLWDLETGSLWTLQNHSDFIYRVAMSADGRRIVSASERELNVWDAHSRTLIATFTCDGPLYCCAFFDSTNIIAGDAIGRLHFLKLEI